MATVYLAHDLRHERDVAVKVLHPDLGAVLGGERFLTEIKTTAKLQHPHILPLLDSGEADGLLFYVMPLVDGVTLRTRLERERQLPVDEALRITSEVAGALDYAHRHGVVHRDIKPENILLHDGRALVADFGIALAVTAASGSRMTQTGLSLGTPQYMAPEQAMGDKVIDARADVYALGCVLYELLTGEPPFSGATVQAIVAKVLTEKPMSPTAVRDTIPRHVEAGIMKALAKLPADRFATAAQFAEALARPELAVAATGAGTVAMASAAMPATRGWRRHAAAAPAVWGALGLALGAAAWGWLRGVEAPRSPVAKFHIRMAPVGLDPIPNLAISPDGRQLAFVGTDSSGRGRIYLRSLDRVEASPVPGTEGGVPRFFSPDGESIAFTQDGKLRTVPLRGGAVTTVTEWTQVGGGTWSDDGTIVFADAASLRRVPATGGMADTLLRVSARGGYQRPHMLPGGQALLVEMIGPSAGAAALRLGDSVATLLVPEAFYPQYVDGFLVYGLADGTIHAAPFDAEALRLTGPAVPVTDGVMVAGPSISKFAVARTGTLAYLPGESVGGRDLVLVDRSGRAQVLPVGQRMYRFPRFSPDGRQLAFHVEVRGGVAGDIWRYAFDGGTLLRLTADSVSAQPEWDPDGTHLVFMGGRQGPRQLFRMPADGSEPPRPLLQRDRAIYESRITPDGRTLVWREDRASTNRDIFMAPLDSLAAARPVLATEFDEKGIALSPDGQWLAYASNETGVNEVYIRRLREVSPRWPVSRHGGTEPRWTRSGEIFFRKGDSILVARVTLGAEPRIDMPRPLFAGSYAATGFEPLWDVSPDGQRFVFVRSLFRRSDAPIGVLLHWFEHRRARQE